MIKKTHRSIKSPRDFTRYMYRRLIFIADGNAIVGEHFLVRLVPLKKRREGRLKRPGEGRRYTTESPVAIGTRPTRAHPLHLPLSLRRLISGLEFPFPPPSL